MKTVTGKVVSTKPSTLSSAAKNLSGFTYLDENGAPDAVRAYLKRASDAFNTLVQFQKDLKAPHSQRKRRASRKPPDFHAKIETLATVDENYPGEEKIKNVENKGKRKKNRAFGVSNEYISLGTTCWKEF
ncbi:hypothetical protein ACH5RR_020878 [Cinchona calisaya]|uniref:Uncharacterized protein n=1 Tax=Cinchona calisaya TaxID=153742 RepID=A0ABD2ZGS9_9GENT